MFRWYKIEARGREGFVCGVREFRADCLDDALRLAWKVWPMAWTLDSIGDRPCDE